jgi:putative membrane protein
MDSQSHSSQPGGPVVLLTIRAGIGGVLMGLANLVPGISGGTMLLAAGVYTNFISAIAEITTFKFRPRSIIVLVTIVVAAGLAILLLAGTIKELVVHHRWVMYSVFIGLTLGGVPIVWRMIGRHTRTMWIGAAIGFIAMGALAYFQQQQMGAGAGASSGLFMLFLAGVAGASAMILPGVSGGYLLLILGQYVPILSAIDTLKKALETGDTGVALQVAMHVCVPVGLGVVVGVVGVSNLLRMCLKRYEKATLGILLGLLLGAVVGLWPFQRGVAPQAGEMIKGRVMTAESLEHVDSEDYRVERFTPSPGQAGGSIGLIIFGFAVTLGISRLGREA